MKKLIIALMFAGVALANQGVQGFCEQGNTAVQTAGLPSTNVVQGSFPACTVSVFTAGTTNLVTIFADNINTPLSNPFTANASGHWLFYSANNQRLDIQLSGGGLPAPWKINDVILNDPNGGIIAPSNLANIRIVDGVRFAQTAAGINAADADLGNVPGEIWIPSPVVTATDAQISIGSRHTLKVFGNLTIEAATKGPILLGNAASLVCASNNSAIQEATTSASMSSMIRLTTQDGSQSNNFIERCQFFGNSGTFTAGVIDASGFRDGWVRDILANFYNSGWGVFVQDIQSGVLGGTASLQIMNTQLAASNTAGCIEISHSVTAAAVLAGIDIHDLNCTGGASLTTAPIVIQDLSANVLVRQISVTNAVIQSSPSSQPAISLTSLGQATVKQANCLSGNPCVKINSPGGLQGVVLDNIYTFGTNALVDAFSSPNVTLAGPVLQHYDLTQGGSTTSSYYNSITKETVANLGGIRIIDGVKFAKSAAGINAADADCVATNNCEIWIAAPVTATDAQISITAGHTLKVMANLTIDSVNKGPILLANGTRLTCTGPSPDNNAEIVNSGTGTSVSMVRATTQDGSQTNMTIDGCFIYGGVQPFSNGIIDATGFGLRGTIKDNKLAGHSSGAGIFIQDNQTGALGGTNNVEILNNTIIGSSTASCITVTHGATNAVAISNILITDLFCAAGATSGNSITIINTSTTASLLRQVHITNSTFNSTPAGGSSISLGGVQNGSVRNATCLSGSSCVTITNSTNNGVIALDNIVNYNGNNTLLDQSAANVTITTPGLIHYDFPIGNTGQVGYLTNVSFLKLQGLSPAAAGTGLGTSPSLTFTGQSTNNGGILQIVAGTTPSSSGTFTITFNVAQSSFGINPPSCEFTAHSTSGVWNARVSFIISSISTTSVVVNWDNNAVNLTGASQYNVHYHCDAH